MAAATIVEEIAAATADAAADGVVVEEEEDASVEDARKAAPAADAISRPQNTRRHRAANPAVTTIGEVSRGDTTTGARMLRAPRAPSRRQTQPKSRFFFPGNRWRNIAASLPQRRHHRPWPSMRFMNSNPR